MNLRFHLPPAFLFFCLFGSLACAAPKGDAWADGFDSPPESAKPRTWWHWISGNVSADGITADLAAMKQIGLGGAQIFTVDQSDVHGPVAFMSPEWRTLVHHALTEADRLHLEMSMEGCDGWSESGGPWVQPAQSMQKVVWTEQEVSGGQKIALNLPQPAAVRGYYADIALFAFPAVTGDGLDQPVRVASSDPRFAAAGVTTPSSLATNTAVAGTVGTPPWVQFEYAQPVACAGVHFTAEGAGRKTKWQWQVSDDGTTFRTVSDFQGSRAIFRAVTAKFFRLQSPPTATPLEIREIHLDSPWSAGLPSRTGLAVEPAGCKFFDLALPPGRVIDPKSLVDLTGKKNWDVPAGKWTIVRLGHTSTGITTHPSTKAGLECDKMSEAAVTSHFQSMFGPVMRDSPEQIGSTLKYVLLDSWEAGCENWTPLMADQFRQRRGYDLTPWLPVLAGYVVGNAELSQRFLWDYRRTLADLVAEEHYGTLRELAHRHHMGLASEAPGIGHPTVADGLQCKGQTDIPMGEFWVNKTRDQNINDPKEAASAAHIYGLRIAATESFTSTPATAAWTNDPFSLKALGDEEFCLGVNRFVFHRYAHQPWLDRQPGMSMGPWGINFERTNTWWGPGSAWIRYLTRCQYLLQQGDFAADLCYFYGEDAPVFFDRGLLTPAVPPGYDYDVCDAEVLLKSMRVVAGRIVLDRGMSYRVLVLPDEERMSLPVLQKIAALVRAGGVVYGPKPRQSPSLTDYPVADARLAQLADEVWGPCDGRSVTEHAYGQVKIVWGEPLEKALAVPPDFASSQGDLLHIHRRDSGGDIYFISNQQNQPVSTLCTFRVEGKIPELWHPDNGGRETLACYQTTAPGLTTVPLHLDPFGSVFVVFRQAAGKAAPVAGVTRDGQDLLAADAEAVALPFVSGDEIHLRVSQNGTYEIRTGADVSMKLAVSSLPPPLTLTGAWSLSFPPHLGAPDRANSIT